MTTRPQRTILATWLAMLTVQTIGSVDSKRKMPAPKQYVAIGVLWGVLFLVADTGAARTAARLSLLLLLTASVIGPFGTRAIQFLELIAKTFAVPPTTGVPGAPPVPGAGVAPSGIPGIQNA